MMELITLQVAVCLISSQSYLTARFQNFAYILLRTVQQATTRLPISKPSLRLRPQRRSPTHTVPSPLREPRCLPRDSPLNPGTLFALQTRSTPRLLPTRRQWTVSWTIVSSGELLQGLRTRRHGSTISWSTGWPRNMAQIIFFVSKCTKNGLNC